MQYNINMIYKYIYIYTYIYTYIYLFIYLFIYLYLHMYTHIDIHTYIYIQYTSWDIMEYNGIWGFTHLSCLHLRQENRMVLIGLVL